MNYYDEFEKEAISLPKIPNAIKKPVSIGFNAMYTIPTVASGAKKGFKEMGAIGDAKRANKLGFSSTTSPQSNLMGSRLFSEHMKMAADNDDEDDDDNDEVYTDNHFNNAYNYIPIGMGAMLLGAGAIQVGRGKMSGKTLIKPVKEVGKVISKPYKKITSFAKGAVKAGDKYKKNAEMTRLFQEYTNKYGPDIISEEGFKQVWNGYVSQMGKFSPGKTPNLKSFHKYLNKNRDNLFNAGVEKAIKDSPASPKQELKKRMKQLGRFTNKTFDDSMHGLIISGVMGAGITGGSLAINALGDEYYRRKDDDEMRKRVRNQWNSNFVHKKVLGKDNKVTENGIKYYTPDERIEGIIRDEVRRMAKSEFNKQNSRHDNRKQSRNKDKRNNFSNMNKTAGVVDFAKKTWNNIPQQKKTNAHNFFKDKVVTNSLGGIAYATTPALAFGAMGRDRYDFQKTGKRRKFPLPKTTKTVLEFNNENDMNSALDKVSMYYPNIDNEDLYKMAGIMDTKFMKGVKNVGGKLSNNLLADDAKDRIGTMALKGLTNTIPVAMVAKATNRNLRGNFERFDSEEYAKNVARPLQRGNIRVTIERGDN